MIFTKLAIKGARCSRCPQNLQILAGSRIEEVRDVRGNCCESNPAKLLKDADAIPFAVCHLARGRVAYQVKDGTPRMVSRLHSVPIQIPISKKDLQHVFWTFDGRPASTVNGTVCLFWLWFCWPLCEKRQEKLLGAHEYKLQSSANQRQPVGLWLLDLWERAACRCTYTLWKSRMI